ncbi:MAG TPA: hypothetical protein VKA57_06920 [Solirubrobacteraceae bacterium]|nr:hypothetical protein [Solirubrobacteraceae bacterium]
MIEDGRLRGCFRGLLGLIEPGVAVNAAWHGETRRRAALTAYVAVNAAWHGETRRRAALTAYVPVNAARSDELGRLPAFTRMSPDGVIADRG